ncbi:Mce family protein [Mycobacteroides abscessus subsp. abscessus]|nr:Mce family protein [Mycobacteroides abscessus subsp. abscessus]
MKSFWDLFAMIADTQKVPFSKTLDVMASLIDGTNDFVPVIGSTNKLLDSLNFMVGPGNTERATAALDCADGSSAVPEHHRGNPIPVLGRSAVRRDRASADT